MNSLTLDINRLKTDGMTYAEISLVHHISNNKIRQALSGVDVDKIDRRGKTRRARAKKLKDSIDPCPQSVLREAESKPNNCSDARWRIELSRRRMESDGAIDYARPPEWVQ